MSSNTQVETVATEATKVDSDPNINEEKPIDYPCSEASDESSVEVKVANVNDVKSDQATMKHKPSSCLFVASLVFSKSDEELITSVTDHFKVYGKITGVKVLRDVHNRPYAFVQYTNDEDCQMAIRKGHNTLLDGRHLRCEAAKVNRTLFVNYNKSYDAAAVRKSVENFGNIESIHPANKYGLIRTHFEESRFWFVKFMYRDDAIRSYASLSNSMNLSVEWAKNIEDKEIKETRYSRNAGTKNFEPRNSTKFDNYSVFVGHLKGDITEDELRERFGRHGSIKDLKLIDRSNAHQDKENRPQRFGFESSALDNFAFIEYKEEISAARAVELENHSIFHDKTIHVQYKEFHGISKGFSHTKKPGRPMGARNYGVKHGSNMNFGKPSPRQNLLAPPPINSIKKANGRRNFYNYEYQEYPFYYYFPGNGGANGNGYDRSPPESPPYMFDMFNPAMHGFPESYYNYSPEYSGFNGYETNCEGMADKPYEADSRSSSSRSKPKSAKSATYVDPATLPSTLDSGNSHKISDKSTDTSIRTHDSVDYYYYSK